MSDRLIRYQIGGVVVTPRSGVKLREELKLCLRSGSSKDGGCRQ